VIPLVQEGWMNTLDGDWKKDTERGRPLAEDAIGKDQLRMMKRFF
jgi:hypothetical protein